MSETITLEYNTIVNRIYPLGCGELNIKEVNQGLPFIEDKDSIAKFGIREHVWFDENCKDASILKKKAYNLLKDWSNPKISK